MSLAPPFVSAILMLCAKNRGISCEQGHSRSFASEFGGAESQNANADEEMKQAQHGHRQHQRQHQRCTTTRPQRRSADDDLDDQQDAHNSFHTGSIMKRISLIMIIGALSLVMVAPLIAQEKTMTTSTGVELVWIPPGDFMMGSPTQEQAWAMSNGVSEAALKREGSPRKTTIKQGFWMGRTDVTVAQWKQFVSATTYVTDAEKNGQSMALQWPAKSWGLVKGANWKDPKFDFRSKDHDPVCCVSWNDAVAYCKWLTDSESTRNKLPRGLIYRLPTEAEWEYACRAGTQTMFWWGDKPQGGDRRINWSGKEDGFEFISPADYFKAHGRNKFGLADMLGNVRQWCLDGFDENGAHEECWTGDQRSHPLRGGAFNCKPATARCSFRDAYGRGDSFSHSGFRVCCGPNR